MAEEINENIVELTKMSLKKVILELETQFLNLDKIKKQQRTEEIKQLADLRVDSENQSVEEVAKEILEFYKPYIE